MVDKDLSMTHCAYYGRKFIEAYVGAGGRGPDSADFVDTTVEDAVLRGARYAASRETAEKPCTCGDFVTLAPILVTFTCPRHGVITLDTRPLVSPTVPYVPLPYTPPPIPSIPNYPWGTGPTWWNQTGQPICQNSEVPLQPVTRDFVGDVVNGGWDAE